MGDGGEQVMLLVERVNAPSSMFEVHLAHRRIAESKWLATARWQTDHHAEHRPQRAAVRNHRHMCSLAALACMVRQEVVEERSDALSDGACAFAAWHGVKVIGIRPQLADFREG